MSPVDGACLALSVDDAARLRPLLELAVAEAAAALHGHWGIQPDHPEDLADSLAWGRALLGRIDDLLPPPAEATIRHFTAAEDQPHLSAALRCLWCGHEGVHVWMDITPMRALECPSCGRCGGLNYAPGY